MSDIKELLDKVLVRCDGKVGEEEIIFETACGKVFKLYHAQDCCERVFVEDICGNLSDLVGSAILQAEESRSNENPIGVVNDCQGSFTWTFYRIATAKGQAVIRWYGTSNGYYSERVDFREVNRI